MYLLSYKFKVSSTGFAILTGWNILTSYNLKINTKFCIINLYFIIGQATLTTVNILSLPNLGTSAVSNILEWIFIAFLPNYAMG